MNIESITRKCIIYVDEEQGSNEEMCFVQDVVERVGRKCVTGPLCGRGDAARRDATQRGGVTTAAAWHTLSFFSSSIIALMISDMTYLHDTC